MRLFSFVAIVLLAVWGSRLPAGPVEAGTSRIPGVVKVLPKLDGFQRLVVRLPRVDKVVIETIPGFRRPDDTTPFVSRSATLVGSEALRAARIWRRLREGTPVQCYNPFYRVSFYLQDSVYLRADVCFDCNKIDINGDYYDISGNRRARNELKDLFGAVTSADRGAKAMAEELLRETDGSEDAILQLGKDPVDDEVTDASVNHGRYMYWT